MTKGKPMRLTKRYNKDGSVSLLGWKGRVVHKSKDYSSIEAFVKGWYGDQPVRFNRARFSKEA